MIARLTGRVAERAGDSLVLDVNGVGYLVHVPVSTLDHVGPVGAALTLHTVMRAPREETPQLFGFATREEKEIFERVTNVNGVGPRLGLAVLSGLSPAAFRRAVLDRNIPALTAISGIGKKTAERLVVELRDRLAQEPLPPEAGGGAGESSAFQDAVTALVTLGYPRPLAVRAVTDVLETLGADARVEDVVRKALGRLSVR